MQHLTRLLLLLAIALPTTQAAQDFPDVEHQQLVTLLRAGGVTVVDVNGTASYQKAHIPGAIDYAAAEKAGDFAKRLPDDKDALIVAYCGGPACKAWKRAAMAASKLGYTNVRHYSAGLAGWTASPEAKTFAADKPAKTEGDAAAGACACAKCAGCVKKDGACACPAKADKAAAAEQKGKDCAKCETKDAAACAKCAKAEGMCAACTAKTGKADAAAAMQCADCDKADKACAHCAAKAKAKAKAADAEAAKPAGGDQADDHSGHDH